MILPPMTLPEGIETIRLHRVTGRNVWVPTRPCRAPQQTISDMGRIGGGQVPLPGEVSRAHPGVRCLDERPECRWHILAGLRQPLEKGLTSIQSPERPRPQ
jgi:magnesium chelatase family protein